MDIIFTPYNPCDLTCIFFAKSAAFEKKSLFKGRDFGITLFQETNINLTWGRDGPLQMWWGGWWGKRNKKQIGQGKSIRAKKKIPASWNFSTVHHHLTRKCSTFLLAEKDPTKKLELLGYAKKLAHRYAFENAFKRVIIVSLGNGKVGVEINQLDIPDCSLDELREDGVVKVNCLDEVLYSDTDEEDGEKPVL